jgi:phage tail tube protein FII
VHNGVNVTTIYHGAFNYCDKLTSVSLPATIISIQDSAFLSCTGLTGELEIPSGVETIEKDTFNGCKHLNSVTFVGKLKSIGETAFYYCEKINSYKFADAQTTELAIGKYAFYGSASIGSIRGCNNNKTYLDAILLNMKQNGSLFDGEGG